MKDVTFSGKVNMGGFILDSGIEGRNEKVGKIENFENLRKPKNKGNTFNGMNENVHALGYLNLGIV